MRFRTTADDTPPFPPPPPLTAPLTDSRFETDPLADDPAPAAALPAAEKGFLDARVRRRMGTPGKSNSSRSELRTKLQKAAQISEKRARGEEVHR